MQGLTEIFRQAVIAGSCHLESGPSRGVGPEKKARYGQPTNHLFEPIISVLGSDRQAGLLLTCRDDALGTSHNPLKRTRQEKASTAGGLVGEDKGDGRFVKWHRPHPAIR